jgi:hypothetical protein
VTADQLVAKLKRQDTVESLLDALRLRPADPALMAALGEKLAARRNASGRAQLFGEFLVERAAAAAPGDFGVRLARERVRLANFWRRSRAAPAAEQPE